MYIYVRAYINKSNMYIDICMYKYMYMYKSIYNVCVYIYIHICMYIYIYIRISMYMYLHISMHTYKHIFIYICTSS